MTFSRKILLGLVLGVATGLFLGDRAAPLRYLADGFIRLLQMTVLPYVTVSLVAGIGGLDAPTARRLFLRVGALTLVLWGLALGAVFLAHAGAAEGPAVNMTWEPVGIGGGGGVYTPSISPPSRGAASKLRSTINANPAPKTSRPARNSAPRNARSRVTGTDTPPTRQTHSA